MIVIPFYLPCYTSLVRTYLPWFVFTFPDSLTSFSKPLKLKIKRRVCSKLKLNVMSGLSDFNNIDIANICQVFFNQ